MQRENETGRNLMIRTILAPVTGNTSDAGGLAAAFLVAEAFQAHVDTLCIRPHPELRAPIEAASIPAPLARRLVKLATDEQARTAASARSVFDMFSDRHGADPAERGSEATPGRLTASWREATGPMSEIVQEEARLSDLVVLARDADGDRTTGPTIEAVIFNSGRPLLLAPSEQASAIGTAPAIAWNGSSVAARAVRAALPFLQRVGKAVILFTDTSEPGRAADPQRLAGYLEWHGITASIRQVTVGHRQVSDALTESALEAGCDLLIMGGYGHSRVRELVLGGVTQDMLRKDTNLPILIAH
jgi:nucleotide-binding universal stress UspA family protein